MFKDLEKCDPYYEYNKVDKLLKKKQSVPVDNYQKDHKLAKLVCFLINTILILSLQFISQELIKYVVLLSANFTYFFGVNTIAYVIESIRHHKHKHDII